MAIMITKHRRGTTDEWQDSSVVPAEGEIVIEECDNGDRKFKIGDGRRLFTELPYTDEELTAKLNVAIARVNELIALKEGDTDPATLDEVVDIRTGYDGVTYSTAGEAVRAIGSDTADLRKSLQQFINADAVDGLLYENNMLYLTAAGVIVSEPVEIKGGSGGGGGGSSTILRLTNNNGTAAITAPQGSPVLLKFTFTSVEDDVPTGNGTCTIAVGGVTKKTFGIPQGYYELDVSDLITAGSNSVRVTCADQYGNSRSLVYTITVIELRLTSIFDSSTPFKGDITYKYTPYGLIEKTVHFLIDGKEVAKSTLTSSGKQSTQVLPAQSHGSHTLDVYMTATMNDVEVESDHLVYEVMCLVDGYTTAMISSVFTETTAKQGDLIAIPFTLYDPTTLTADIQLKVTYKKEGKDITYSTNNITVDRSPQLWSTRQYPQGIVTFTIIYKYNWNTEFETFLNEIVRSYTVTVSEPDINVEAVTNDLQLLLTSAGRTNNEVDPAVWAYDSIKTTFENFNWKSNGWIADATGDTCLRFTGDAKATIQFKPFEADFKEYGKTIEFEFAVRDVNTRDAVIIDCYQGGIGFQATADTAFLKSEGTTVTCNYKDEERLRIGFSIERMEDQTRFIAIYLDGVLSGITQYSTTDNFKQPEPVNITVGSELCGIDLYSVRIYSSGLTAPDMINNYIADMSEPVQKLDLFTDNDIYDEYTGLLSYPKLKQRIPTVTFIGKMPTYKGDKKKNSVRMIFEHPTEPELNFDEILAQIDVQGTSSAGYVRKNWKTKHSSKHTHMKGELPAKVFCLKVDYAEGTGTHNTQNANFAETLYSEKILAQLDDERVRTTITGFPIVIFHLDTDDMDLIKNITKEELALRTDVVFSSKGNFNYDKDAEDVFGFNDNYDVECWEFCNNTSASVRFLGEIPTDYSSDFEARYHPRLGDLEDLEDADVKDEAKIAELKAEMIVRFKRMHDWVLSTSQEQATGEALEEPYHDTLGTEYTHDTAAYRLAKFRTEFNQYFDLHYTAIYYTYTFFALMVDQRAKNLFLTYWHDRDEDGNVLETGKWYPYFYDNDTSFGINNEGKKVFDYFHEDTDVVAGQKVYNGQDSTLWVNFRQCFGSTIRDTYADLRAGKLTEDKLLSQFITKGSDMWSASVYNEDAEYKYVSLARPDYDEDNDGEMDTTSTYLYQVTGNGEHHFKYFVANRLKYCDSKWYAGNYFTDQIYLRIYTPQLAQYSEGMSDAEKAEIDAKNEAITRSIAAVPACADISVVPYSDVYAGVRYKAVSGDDITLNLQQQRTSKGTLVTFKAPENETFNDTETYIYGASDLSSLGDLSPLYCGYIDVSKASKLTELKIGNSAEGYQNLNLHKLSVGSNQLLKKIDISNCSELTDPLDVSNCKNIETILARGSGITSVVLPEAGYVKTLQLPATVTNLTIKNQLYIEELSLESYRNLTTLCIDNCPTIDSTALLEQCKDADGNYTVNRLRLTDLNWRFNDISFLKSLYSIGGVDQNDLNTDSAYLVGTCYIDELTGEEMAEINSHYPYLNITYRKLVSNLIFMDSTGTTELYRQEITSYNGRAANGSCPVDQGIIEVPTKTPTAQYYFTWNGWTTINGTAAQIDALHAVSANRYVYPAFEPHIQSYVVKFYNDEQLLESNKWFYGTTAVYGDGNGDGLMDPEKTPEKINTTAPELFEFTGWHPSPDYVTGPMSCYAQYYIDESTFYPIGLNDFEYELHGSELEITKYVAVDSVIAIPNTFEIEGQEYTVTTVGGFMDSDVELITLPTTAKVYSSLAFNNCGRLSSVTIYEATEEINDMCFANCTKLTTVNYRARNARVIRSSTTTSPFEATKTKEGITLTVGKDVEIIPDYLFNQTKEPMDTSCVARIIWEDGCACKTIGKYAFCRSNVQELTLPDQLELIEIQAFYVNRGITQVVLPESVKKVRNLAFGYCDHMTTFTIGSNVETIEDEVFAYDGMLETIIVDPNNQHFIMVDGCLINTDTNRLVRGTPSCLAVPDSVLSVATHAFSALANIVSMHLPDNLSTVPSHCFYGCTSLDNINFPLSLTSIGVQAFRLCYNLGKSANGIIRLPDSISEIYSYSFSECNSLVDVTLPLGMTRIGGGAFHTCTKLHTVTFQSIPRVTPASGDRLADVSNYGDNCFTGCSNLRVINFPGTKEFAEQYDIWNRMGVDTTVVQINYEYEVTQ